MRNPVCGNCGGPPMLGELSLEEHHLRVENSRFRDELTRVCALTAKFIGKPLSLMAPPQMHQPYPLPGSSLDIAAADLGSVPPSTMPVTTISDLAAGSVSSPLGTVITPSATGPLSMVGIDKFNFLELAMNAMDELVNMAQMGEPLWIPSVSLPGSPVKETLNFKEYSRAFTPCIGLKPDGCLRHLGSLALSSSTVVLLLWRPSWMRFFSCNYAPSFTFFIACVLELTRLFEFSLSQGRWSDMFSCMVGKVSTLEKISTGVAGCRNGALLLVSVK
jgi:homeobox-leucine zipper protein